MAKTGKKGYKGPRITNAVMGLDEAGRKAWLADLKVSDGERSKIADRLTKKLAKGIKPRKFNLDTFKAGAEKLDIATLVEIQKVVTPLITAGKDAEKARIAAALQKLQEEAAALA